LHKEFSPHTPRWAGTRRNITCSHPWGRRRRLCTDNKVHCMGAHHLYGALSQWGLLDPTKPAYNHSRPDGRLKLIASAVNWLWISMPAIQVTVPTYCYGELASFINFVHYCSPSSGFYGTWKITEAVTRTIHLDASPDYWCLHLQYPPIFKHNAICATTLTIYPGLGQALNNAGLHTWWLSPHTTMLNFKTCLTKILVFRCVLRWLQHTAVTCICFQKYEHLVWYVESSVVFAVCWTELQFEFDVWYNVCYRDTVVILAEFIFQSVPYKIVRVMYSKVCFFMHMHWNSLNLQYQLPVSIQFWFADW